jgi:hypothetical protein
MMPHCKSTSIYSYFSLRLTYKLAAIHCIAWDELDNILVLFSVRDHSRWLLLKMTKNISDKIPEHFSIFSEIPYLKQIRKLFLNLKHRCGRNVKSLKSADQLYNKAP